MPTYDYKCLTCDVQFERFQGITAPPIEECPECGGKVKRLIGTGAGPTSKGSGSYTTDYGSASYKESTKQNKNSLPNKSKTKKKEKKAYTSSKVQQLESSFAARLSSFRVPWMFDRLNTEHLIISIPSNAIAGIVPKVSGMIVQILATCPPGMVRFLLIDPVGLGQNFASFHALADYDEQLSYQQGLE